MKGRPSKKALKQLAKSLRERAFDTYGLPPDEAGKQALIDRLDWLTRFVKDADEYEKHTGDTQFKWARNSCSRVTLPNTRHRLAKFGIIFRKDKDGSYSPVEDFWGSARKLPRRHENINERLSSLLEESGMSNRQIAQAAGINVNTISALLHNRVSPLTVHGEWIDGARRLCAFLGLSPEEVFPESLWKPVQRRAYRGFMRGVYLQNMRQGFTDEKVRDNERKACVRKMLALLTPAQRNVVALNLGLNGGGPQDLWTIARAYGVSYIRIHIVLSRAFRRLRHPCVLRTVGELHDETDLPAVEKATDVLRPTGKVRRRL